MSRILLTIFACAFLTCVIGCGDTPDGGNPITQNKSGAEPSDPATKKGASTSQPWESPTGLTVLVANQIGHDGNRISALLKIAEYLINTSEKTKASEVLAQAKTLTLKQSGPVGLRIMNLISIGEFQHRVDQKKEALTTLNLAREQVVSSLKPENRYVLLSRTALTFCRIGELKPGQNVFAEALADTQSMEPRTRSFAQLLISLDQAKAGETESASSLLKKSLQSDLSYSIQKDYAIKFARAGAPALAAQIAVSRIERDRLGVLVSIVAQELARNDQIPHALELIEKSTAVAGKASALSKLCGTLKNPTDRRNAVRILDQLLVEAGNIPLTEGSHRPNAQQSIAIAFARLGDRTRAKEIANAARSQVSQLPSDYQKAHASARVSIALGVIGDDSQSRKLFDDAIQYSNGVSPPRLKASVLQSIALWHLQAGNRKSAMEAFGLAVKAEPAQTHQASFFAKALLKNNEYELAAETASLIGRASDRDTILEDAITELARIGDFKNALRHVSTMEQRSQHRVLKEIAYQQAFRGDSTAAQSTIQRIDNEFSRAAALSRAAEGLAKSGRFDQAVEIASNLGQGQKTKALLSVAIELATTGAENNERAPANKKVSTRRIKKSFTSAEKAAAQQIAKAVAQSK